MDALLASSLAARKRGVDSMSVFTGGREEKKAMSKKKKAVWCEMRCAGEHGAALCRAWVSCLPASLVCILAFA